VKQMWQHALADMLAMQLKFIIRKWGAASTICFHMSGDNLDVESWSMGKRKRVQGAVESSSPDVTHPDVSRHEILALKRHQNFSNGQDAPSEIPMTLKKSGGDARREAARNVIAQKEAEEYETTQAIRSAVEHNFVEGNWGDKELRNILTCSVVEQIQQKMASSSVSKVSKIAAEILATGDFDGVDPPFCARGIADAFKKMNEDPHYQPHCQGGRPTILNSDTAHHFWKFVEKELRSENPTGQSSVTDPPEYIKRCWKLFYSQNDVAEPEISQSTMKKALELFLSFAVKEPGQKKNQRGAEAMDDPRNSISFAALIYLIMAWRPDELKGNWDDVSFMVAEEMGVVKICYGHKEVTEQMKKLGRSMAWHHEEDGPKKQVRMFVVGFLTQGSGKLPLAVCKFYDRSLKQKDRVMARYIGKAINGCEMWWVWVKLPSDGGFNRIFVCMLRLSLLTIIVQGIY